MKLPSRSEYQHSGIIKFFFSLRNVLVSTCLDTGSKNKARVSLEAKCKLKITKDSSDLLKVYQNYRKVSNTNRP